MQRRGCAPNPQTFVATLVACSNTAALDSGKNIHAQICRYKLEHHQFVANSLVDFYAKCGAMAEAEMIFASLEPESRNSVTWGAILAGYARQGDTDRALELFGTMRDEGMVEQCRGLFRAMRERYGIAPEIEHYHCVVDALGRANLLDEAVAMARSMPFVANPVTWKTLLSASAKWRNVEVGKLVFEKLGSDRGDIPCVLMANIYAAAQEP